jgi:P-type Ca2+ transporter type 2C
MTLQVGRPARPVTPERWYARPADDVASALGVDPVVGLAARAADERLRGSGPNALPEEAPEPGWRRFLGEYRSYMQIILVAAAIVSMVVQEWGTAVLLLALTVLNAVVGLRQQGKAESAMNALKSMLKATARVRRDGSETEIPAEQLVVGDVVLLSAGDQVPADGRIIAASALQIDESALTAGPRGQPVLVVGDLQPALQAGFGYPEVLGHLGDRRLALPDHRDHVTTELRRIRLGRDADPSSEPRPHMQGVN